MKNKPRFSIRSQKIELKNGESTIEKKVLQEVIRRCRRKGEGREVKKKVHVPSPYYPIS